ncbi:MAG: arsenite methyltransferase [Verrucomicrobia bacterium]|nr:arsenite methyltransferase [Verrucomicrobiota bacterium]MCG2678530.1 arsenite methyltransferase [Kiritimatiellia bacterium]MBU4247445.1 arsenite methyltransferase [Verrucomicrobiota bacterium]MBU4292276.1 arsenite methyltransferase [Verrucomicrobiota bacterium]MBU4429823.1 arsenite methyltransferase [Verrucomicrobiota bacterium]
MNKHSEHPEQTRRMVRQHYGRVAGTGGQAPCCASGGESQCCDAGAPPADLRAIARRLGYSEAQLAALPENVNLGLGCGNPVAMALLQPGETVLDLGSGAGMDCFIAAQAVGPTGRVIGVDMTPEMLSKARAGVGKHTNIEFRLGEIEHLPAADNSVDVIMSNCVINLSPEKQQVFNETYRVLRPGGRLAISDVIQTRPFKGTRWAGKTHLSACISGSVTVQELETMLTKAGFADVRIALNEASRAFIKDWDPGSGVEHYICSAFIEARK